MQLNGRTDKWGTEEQIDIINYSVSGFGTNHSVLNAVEDYPGLFVWAAGNNGNNVDTLSDIEDYDLDNCISVGATDKDGNRSVWGSESSNYGEAVNIFAPGGKNFSSDHNIPTTSLNNGYAYFNGTSAAAPHVSGTAALLLSYDQGLTAGEIKNILLNSAKSIIIDGMSAKLLDAGEALSNIYNPHRLILENEGYFSSGGGCTTGDSGWNIKVTNPLLITEIRVIYNIRMCYGGDAQAWTGLSHIAYFDLPGKSSKTVE